MAMAQTVYSEKQASLKCVDENEILYDDTEKYLRRINSTEVLLHEESYGELLRNVNLCQDALLMFLKQRIILCEPRVRYNPANDIARLDEQIHALSLSLKLKSFLKEVSSVGYKCLKDENMLENLVEFDSEQSANVMLFGKMEKVIGRFDMVTLIDKADLTTDSIRDGKDHIQQRKHLHTKKHIKGYSEDAPCLSPKQQMKKEQIGKPVTGTDLLKTTSMYNNTVDVDRWERAVISIILTPRNSLYAADLYNLLIFSYLNNITRFYCVVLHVGPLVDKQEIVLYEFKIPSKITELISSFDRSVIITEPQENINQKFEVCLTIQKTASLSPNNQSNSVVQTDQSNDVSDSDQSMIQTNVLDLNQLETLFRQTFGTRLQTVADLKLYFRYYINDCEGVKDHLKDKQQRYERYIAKKEAKRERKLNKKKVTNPSNYTGNDTLCQSVVANASS